MKKWLKNVDGLGILLNPSMSSKLSSSTYSLIAFAPSDELA